VQTVQHAACGAEVGPQVTGDGLYLGITPDGLIEGERDALVTLRSAINNALAHGRGTADLSDVDGEDIQIVVRRVGP